VDTAITRHLTKRFDMSKTFPYVLKVISYKPVKKMLMAAFKFVTLLRYYWIIFRDYMLVKFLSLTVAGLLIAYVTSRMVPNSCLQVLAGLVVSCSFAALIAGYVNWIGDKHSLVTKTLNAFSTAPLSQFLENGFDHRFQGQLWGKVNNYDIVMNPGHGSKNTFITIRIPIAMGTESEKLTELNPFFRIVEDNLMYMAKADIENYTDKFNYFELMNMITKATEKLQELNFEPFKFADA